MSSGRKRYCVFGCTILGAYMHRFPHPERQSDLFKKWVSAVGDKLKETEPLKIYKNKKICDHHFRPDQKVACHRLMHNSVPCVNLMNLNGPLSVPTSLSVQMEHNYCLPGGFHTAEVVAIDGALPSRLSPHGQPSTTQPSIDEALLSRLNPHDQPSTSQSSIDKDFKSSSEFVLKQFKTAKKKIRKLKSRLQKSMKQEKNYKTRLANAEKMLNGSDAINILTKNMTLSAKIFTGMQFRQALKKPKGRRYNIQEKVLALSIFKKSPKCYNHLAKFFKLPSAKSLKNLLSDIKLTPGINNIIFEKLKESVGDLSEEDRLCTLIFDEMSLSPQVHYNSSKDELKGLISHNEEIKLANHALVFMIKGIKKNYKQPVAYYFTQNLKTIELKNIIKDVIYNVHSTGLHILCTVCDQGATNVSAINSLVEETKETYLKKGNEWRNEFFEIDHRKIIPLYDVPHLLKGLRNNLLTKDLAYTDFEDNNKEKVVKWRYFQWLYEADKSRGELRYLHKITEEHVEPSKIKKMRVKMAAQLFSHSVAVTTDHLTARGILPEECRQLIPLVLFIDKLFDSLNAGTFHIPDGKVYRGAVRRSSPHTKLWSDALKFLKNMKYLVHKKAGNKMRLVESSIPSVKNFIKTIEGMQVIWKMLNQKYSLDCMLTRNFNQDPVENFFGNIRSLGVRNVSPNCQSFEGAFKTLLLNNFSCQQAVNANCEEDFNACLQTIEFFLSEKEKLRNAAFAGVEEKNVEISAGVLEALSNVPTGVNPNETQGRYVCGWVLSKCLSKIVKNCSACKATLINNNSNANNAYIRAKEYDKKKQWLSYPSEALGNCFKEIQEITTTFLKTNLQRQKVKENIKLLTDSFVSFPSDCEVHKSSLQKYFTETTINILIFSWCRSINRILSGKIKNQDEDDPLKRCAQLYYDSHKNRK